MTDDRLHRIESAVHAQQDWAQKHDVHDATEFESAREERRAIGKDLNDRFAVIEKRLFDEREGYLPRIERQTMATNGKVADLYKWRYMLTGVWVALSTITLPMIYFVLRIYFRV